MTTTGEVRPEILRLDNTKRSCAAECLRKFYWQYERHLKSKIGSSALRYGIVWHAAMDAFYSHIAEHGWTRDGKPLEMAVLTARMEWNEYTNGQTFYDDYRNLQNLMTSLVSYMDHFAFDEGMLKIIESEHVFCLPMFPENPEEELVAGNDCPTTGPVTREDPAAVEPMFYFTGMIDLEVELNGQPWIIDHKTTGKQISLMASQLRDSPQFIGYTYAASQELPVHPNGFLIVIHHLSAYKSRITNEYGKPKIDFDRVPEIYTPFDIAQWRLGIFDIARQILRCKQTGVWPMRLDSCHTFGNCAFGALCKQQKPITDVYYEDGFFVDDPWDITAETKKRADRRAALLRGEVKI